MNKLSTQKRAEVLALLVEGMSIRATVRVTGVAKNTITKLLADLGQACSDYQNETLQNLICPVVECDEILTLLEEPPPPPRLRGRRDRGSGRRDRSALSQYSVDLGLCDWAQDTWGVWHQAWLSLPRRRLVTWPRSSTG